MSLTAPHLEQFLVNPPPDGEDYSISIPRDNLGLPGAPAGSSTFEATHGCDQVRKLLHHGVIKLSDLGIAILLACSSKRGLGRAALLWFRWNYSLIFCAARQLRQAPPSSTTIMI